MKASHVGHFKFPGSFMEAKLKNTNLVEFILIILVFNLMKPKYYH